MSSKILVQDGGRQTIVEIGSDPITIGRDPSSRIVIEDRLASRHHGRFFWDESEFIYEDLGSSNGSLLAGKKIDRVPLGDGDSIHIGEAELRVEIPGVQGSSDVTPVLDDVEVAELQQSVVVSDEPSGQRLRMEQDGVVSWIPVSSELVIGRSPEVDVILDDSRISSRHATIKEKDGRWFVNDLDSGNGIVVGNRKMKNLELQDNRSFRIGQVEFFVHGFGTPDPAAIARSPASTSPELVVTRSSNIDVGPEGSSGLSTLVFVGILAIVVYSGYGFLKDLATNPDLAVSEGDRLVGEGFFEQRDPGPIEGASWRIVTGEGSIQVVQGDGAPQGKKWMTAQGDPGVDGVFRVQFQDLFEVKAGQGIGVSGRVANGGFDRVGICVRWFERGDSGDVVVAENFTKLRANSNWTSVAAEFPAPIEGAGGSARISIVGIGNQTGSFRCDQIEARTIESASTSSTRVVAGESGQEISMEFDDRGVAQLYRGKTELISDMRIALGSARPMPWGQLLPSQKEPVVVGDDDSFRLSYEIQEVGENAVIQQFARSIGWRIATTWSPQRSIPMMLVGKVSSRRVGEPVQIFGGDGSGTYHEKLSSLESCTGTEISLGRGTSQVVILFNMPIEFSVTPEPGGRGLLLIANAGLVSSGGSIDISIAASSEREQAQVQAVQQKIAAALSARQEGQAVKLITEARDAFPWRDDLFDKLDQLEKQIEVEIKAAADQIEAVQADLERYPGSPAGQFLDQICQASMVRFAGLQPAIRASEIQAMRDQTERTAQDLLSATRIEQVLIHARAASGRDRNEIARFYYQWVVDNHTGTVGAAEALQGLKILDVRGN